MSARADPAGLLATYGTALAAAILFLIFAVAAPNFLNPTNLLNVLKQISFLAILGFGQHALDSVCAETTARDVNGHWISPVENSFKLVQ